MVTFRVCLALEAILLLSTATQADAKAAQRDRAAKAALALAAAAKEPAVAAAPSPRPAVRCYPGGCKAAMDDGKPLVVYVSCEARAVEGAIVAQCSAETFGDTAGPAIVVGYPRGDRMFVERTLAGDAKPDEVLRAVKEAAKKTTPPPKQMPPAVGADSWRISADVCPCGPGCKCAPCECGGRATQPVSTVSASGGDGLAEVNAKRATKGLPPFTHDPGLAAAAKACAEYRATRLMFGHTSNDFGFLPAGTKCDATGCAAYPPSYGWLSCATFDDYTRAGAHWSLGRDGKRYMHLFIGYGAPSLTRSTESTAAPPDSGVVVQPPAPQPKLEVFEYWTFDRQGRLVKRRAVREVLPPPPPVQPGWQLTPQVAPYYAGAYCPGRT